MAIYNPIPFKPISYLAQDGRARMLVIFWLLFCVFVIPSGMLTRIFELTGIPLNLYGLELHITVYLPMILCVPLCLTFGFFWAALPAYFSTFLVALLGDMPVYWIVVFSFANPIGMAMLVMIYRITPTTINLHSISAFLVFVVASFLASLSGSIGSFIWTYTNQVDLHDFFRVWQGWWMGGFLQSVFICAPLLYLFADKLIQWKQHCIPGNKSVQENRSAIKLAIILITMVLIAFTWLALQISLMNIADQVTLVGGPDETKALSDAIDVLSFPVLIYIFILAFIGYFVFYFVDYWALRLEKVNDELKKQNSKLYELSIKDNLTRIYNRGYLFTQVPKVISFLKEGGQSIAFMLIDLDNFKNINDSYGHQAGDKVLQQFSQSVKDMIKEGQIFARFGGEEFILVAPNLSALEAKEYAEGLLKMTQLSKVSYKEHTIKFTISVGVFVTKHLEVPVDHMIDEADKALYQAKNNGRNQLVLVSD